MRLADTVLARQRALSSAIGVLLAGIARTSHRDEGVHALALEAAEITAAVRAAPAARAKRDVQARAVREARAVLGTFLESKGPALAITRERHSGIAGITPGIGGFPSSIGAGGEDKQEEDEKQMDA